jgi:hypothetical protein
VFSINLVNSCTDFKSNQEKKKLEMKKIVVSLALAFLMQNAHAIFFFIPIPNLAKPAELQKLIDAYEKSSETKAVAFVSEDKTFGSKQWVWAHKSGVMTPDEANSIALRSCEASLMSVKSQLAGGKPIYDFGQKRCELYKFTNETVMLPKVTPIEPPPKVEESPIARKLKELEGLFNQKLITQEEYETKRKEILSNM